MQKAGKGSAGPGMARDGWPANAYRAIVALLFLGLASCASPPSGGTFSATAPYNTVFHACVAAAADIGFGVTSSDAASGFISGGQGVVAGQGATVTMSVSVRKAVGHVEVDVDFVRPPGTLSLGDFSTLYDEYVAAVRRRVPSVAVMSRKS